MNLPTSPLSLALVGACLLTFKSAYAQTLQSPAPAATAPPAARAPTAAASAPAAAAAAAAATTPDSRVVVTGSRESDTEARRRASAAKIVIGREEIDKFGDANIGEVLRRLPGVTTPGAPGRGGPPRMRGLGGGFTQLLIDGQRMPPGFSLESLTPEQVERIEILRAPTAETGARAIAGTINIITREGFKLRLNDLRLGMGYENGRVTPGLHWTHNNTSGALTYNLSASVFKRQREDEGSTRTTLTDQSNGPSNGTLLEDRLLSSRLRDTRTGANATARLTWRLGESGDMLTLMPSVFHAQIASDTRWGLTQALRRSSTPVFYDTADSVVDASFTTGRLGLQWRQRLGDMRVEANGHGNVWSSRNHTQRNDYVNGTGTPLRTFDDRTSSGERSLNLSVKGSLLAGGGSEGAPKAEHSLVTGAEIEGVNRDETRVSVPDLSGFGENLKASSLRLAAYVQDEWAISPNWAAHAGLRWEGITTRGDSADASNPTRPTNRSSVWTPLLHAVWKPDAKSRDQVRMSLTRSYRSPGLGSLIARPSINRDYAATGANVETSPDNAGNPNLKPELATGVDVAIERYLEGGGVLSANLFHRSISNLMRGVTTLETVSWSPVQRYVRRQRNIGDATTSGIELEAKFRLDQIFTGAPGVEMRSNLSFFRSRVAAVPGPDNRLDQQAKATANIGADYRLRGLPFTLGGSVNWVPGYTTRVESDQTVTVTTKTVWDAFALWTISPTVGLRLLGSNLDPRDFITTTANDSGVGSAAERLTARNTNVSYINWQLRLELKL